jgi:hypothetical protein
MELFQIRTETKQPKPGDKPAPYTASYTDLSQAVSKAQSVMEKNLRQHPDQMSAVFVDWTDGKNIRPGVFGLVTGKDPETGALRISEAVSVNPATQSKPGMIDTMLKNLKYPYLAEVHAAPNNTILFSFPDLDSALKEHYGQMNNIFVRNQEKWSEPKTMRIDIVRPNEQGGRLPVARLEGTFEPGKPFSITVAPGQEITEAEKEQIEAFAKSIGAIFHPSQTESGQE